ncbi:MAG: murein transglycosylase A [Pontixanthobacter sp.]
MSALLGAAALSACSGIVPESAPPQTSVPAPSAPVLTPPPPTLPPVMHPPTTALLAGVQIAAPFATFDIQIADAATALVSFVESCPVVTRRTDRSGLTQTWDWVNACDRAAKFAGDPRAFFAANFTPVRVGTGIAFATGYFEPEIRGCRLPRAGCDTPIYPMPPDLIRDWPADMAMSEQTGRAPLGRRNAAGEFVPYYTRAEIEDGALSATVAPIAYAADPVEFFFLQIQGSGRVALDDGSILRIGYAGQNGHGYTGIGGVMRERGLLGEEPGQYAGSMQGIMAYIRENPAEGRALMRMNESWVFFRELTGDGPIGSIGVPVRGSSSVAVDPRYVPYGAPVWLDLDRDEADGLWIAQDTGGAIKGQNRFDTFWGAGENARRIAGGMSARGTALILLPHEAAARYQTQ